MAITAYADGVLFWRSDIPAASRQILEPKLKLEVNKAGSFSFSIYKNNPIYSSLNPLKTIIEVKDDGEMLFRGRVLDVKRDLFGQRKVTCEGDLTFLLDSWMAPTEVTETVESFFTRVLNAHDRQVDTWKQFYKGTVSIAEKDTRTYFNISSYTKCSDVLDSELLQVYGGILKTWYANNATAIDYIKDPSVDESGFPLNTQGVRYGVNLVDFEEEYPIQDIFTVLLPLGANKLTISSVNSGSIYLENAAAIEKFGRIIRVESWDDISNATTLKTTAQKFLNEQSKIYPNDLTVKAVDLRCLDKSNTPIKLMDRVKVVVKPLDIDVTLFCLSIEYDFYNPENNSYKLGTFIPADKHKGSKKSSRGRGGSGSSRSSRGISSGVSAVSTEVAEFKDQTKEDFTLVRQNISLQAAEVLELQVQGQNHETRITLNEQAITAEATNRQTGDNELATRITVTENGLSSKVNKGSIISEINQSAEEILIQAQKINLSGYVTADELSATNAKLNSFYSTSGSAVILRTDTLDVSTSLTLNDNGIYRGMHWNDVYKDGYVNTDAVKIVGNNSLNLAHYHSITATAGTGSDAGKITFTLGSPQRTAGITNFNIADTQFYKDGVSAAKAAMKIALDATNHSISVSEDGTITGGSVTSSCSAIYDSSTHAYALSSAAKIGTTIMATGSGSSNTDAYDDGFQSGYDTGAWEYNPTSASYVSIYSWASDYSSATVNIQTSNSNGSTTHTQSLRVSGVNTAAAVSYGITTGKNSVTASDVTISSVTINSAGTAATIKMKVANGSTITKIASIS